MATNTGLTGLLDRLERGGSTATTAAAKHSLTATAQSHSGQFPLGNMIRGQSAVAVRKNTTATPTAKETAAPLASQRLQPPKVNDAFAGVDPEVTLNPSVLSTENAVQIIESGKLDEPAMLFLLSLNPSHPTAMAVIQQPLSFDGLISIWNTNQDYLNPDEFWNTAVKKVDWNGLSEEELGVLTEIKHPSIFAKMLRTWNYALEEKLGMLNASAFHPEVLMAILEDLEDSETSEFFGAIHKNGLENKVSSALIALLREKPEAMEAKALVSLADQINTHSFWDFVAKVITST